MQSEAIVSSKGQVTRPAAMRAMELVIKPELPMSAYYGMLKVYNLNPAGLEIEKEPDREFE